MADEARALKTLSVDEAREMALVDLAYQILTETNKPIYYRDLMDEVAKLRNMTEEEVKAAIAILYTEINIDGRFLCIGNNTWGLKRWYPVDKTADKTTGGKKFIRKDVDDDLYDDEDEDLFLEEEELLDEEEEDFDLVDDEEDLEYEELEEIDEVDDLAEEAVDENEDAVEDEEDEF
ncbi:DNA-directed RNA polymerase subunit delta [Effusibacillus consociatus]|uniref:Probable DNA-directed RNA polymerase subunit delta n=1 Tax=Effusibacillus consociatus TaxID=1117041 RepID=A0ABV9Q2F6_9BACL